MFAAAGELRESGRLSEVDEKTLDLAGKWFSENLPVPDRLSVSRRPRRKAQAISWFRDTSIEAISRIRAYAAVLEEYGVAVEMIHTDRPGFIVYEDEWQVAAYPFSDTMT
ncbi:MAG: hypothetical protein DI565_07495 [Ancylobacter novellus]|uniref:Uncharacterized protein n=1 Tax=Ancylobacter novellus TaxID=921 RepID=A0A2W5KMW8_ANCNO|nr:MAG: hypothetical protein DI565_07495 [Ancylobacter novellus]